MTPFRQTGRAHLESHLPKELGELAHLLFEWPIRQAPRLALPGCILGAAVLQAAMVVLFSISYTTPSEVQPDSPQIYFIPPDSAVARRIGPWLAANDPAVFSPQYDTRGAIPSPPPLKYRPSYEEPPPPLRPLPAEIADPIEPPLFPRMADTLVKRAHPSTALPSASAESPLPVQTVIRWQDDLANRQVISRSGTPTAPPAPLGSVPQPSLYEVGISAEGLPMHCVQLESSGDPATDEAGSIWIHAQRFRPTDQESWGRVLILWGAPTVGTTNASPTKP